MRYLVTFLFFCITCLSYSQKMRYDSLQNINKSNYTQLVGQTLYAPKGELVVRNLFWSNKSGKIYKPHPDWVLYPKYSIPDYVLNKHYLIEKIITKSTPLLKTRITETDEVVYINLDALLNYTTSPVMFVDGYIQKCKQLFLNRQLYMDTNKYNKYLPTSFNTKAPALASFYCNSIRVTTKQEHGGTLLLSYRTTSSSPAEIDIVDYLRSRVTKSQADERICVAEELAEIKAKEEAEKKRIQDSTAVVKKQQEEKEDSLILAQMKKKYMHKTWYYRRGDWQYQRFKPIEVIDIQVERNSEGYQHFPMKLLYKGSDYVVSHNAIILDDGQCTFDMAFHNIPPEKEFPTVKHWKEVKVYKLVLGMNKQEVELVKGMPTKINKTKGRWGVHEQWVYSNSFGTHYVYFENGRLTAIQD